MATSGASGSRRAFYYNCATNTTTLLGVLSGQTASSARGMNNSEVVGYSGPLAFVVSINGNTPGPMQDLNTLIAPGTGWSLRNAYGVDSAGNIVGGGTLNGVADAFLLRPALLGDANLDGTVDVNDLSVVLTQYDKSVGMSWSTGDFNGDGTVDVNDLSNVLTNYDKTAGLSAAGVKAVPEPGAIVLLAVGIAGLLAYFRRK